MKTVAEMVKELTAKANDKMNEGKGFVKGLIKSMIDIDDDENIQMVRSMNKALDDTTELANDVMQIAVSQQEQIDAMIENIERITALMGSNNEILGLIEKNTRPAETNCSNK